MAIVCVCLCVKKSIGVAQTRVKKWIFKGGVCVSWCGWIRLSVSNREFSIRRTHTRGRKNDRFLFRIN